MKSIFLESHHINNLYFGFGQFNYQLLKAYQDIDSKEFKFDIHGKDISFLKSEFGKSFGYKKYFSMRRYPTFRIRKKYDLWHSLNQNTKVEPYSSRIPYLLTVHNIHQIDANSPKLLAKNAYFQEKLNRSSAIAYISNYAKQSTHDNYDIPKVPEFVIYNGNPVSNIVIDDSYQPQYIPKNPFLFAIGEITGRKNFITLVHMLRLLPDLELVIAGKNNTREGIEILEVAANLGMKDRVTLPGKMPDAEKQWYYKNCEAFVFPSLREGFGLPIIEAMRFGKPVFSSNLTALPEVGGDLAYYWDNFDPQYMADVFEKGMNDYGNRSDLKEKLVSRSLEFSWEKAAHEYHDVYRKLLL